MKKRMGKILLEYTSIFLTWVRLYPLCGSSCNTHYVSLTTFYPLGPDLDNGGGVLHAPAEVVLVILAADHGHGAVLTQATALLKFLEQL